ncbi:MAG: O-antigen ligase family protein [Terriglobales bacterium]
MNTTPISDLPQNLYYGGGGATFVTPLGIAILVVAALLIFLVPRKYVIWPLLAGALLVPLSVEVVVFGLHLQSYRLTLLAGCLRMAWDVLVKRDFYPRRMTSLDKVFIAWAVVSTVTFCILWGEWAAVVNKIGFLYTTLAAYVIVRHLIRNKADVLRAIKVMAVVLAIIAPLMLREHITGSNPFSLAGANPETERRNGEDRADGPFSHPIIAGTVGAMTLPLFVGLWWQRNRLLAATGVIASTMMVVASVSATPVMTYLAAVGALMLWPARRYLRFFRWGLVAGIIGLQLVMKSPVWFVLSHIGNLTGGTGWHRAYLIDNFVRHFWEWWLIGTRNNSQWGYFMWDSINTYVNAGVEGGLITFILFIAIFVYAYKRAGAARKMAEGSGSRRDALLIWAIGACIFANTVAFFGISYFDQSMLLWYCVLAMASVTTKFVADPKRSQVQLQVADASAEMPAPDPVLAGSQTMTSLLRQA